MNDMRKQFYTTDPKTARQFNLLSSDDFWKHVDQAYKAFANDYYYADLGAEELVCFDKLHRKALRKFLNLFIGSKPL